MVELLKMLGEYIEETTGLPYDIQPSAGHPQEPHIVIIPDELDIQSLQTLDPESRAQMHLIGLNLIIELKGEGGELPFLDHIIRSSITVNSLFGASFNVKLGGESLGFSVKLEKNRKGRFVPIATGGQLPFRYNESWKGQLTFRQIIRREDGQTEKQH